MYIYRTALDMTLMSPSSSSLTSSTVSSPSAAYLPSCKQNVLHPSSLHRIFLFFGHIRVFTCAICFGGVRLSSMCLCVHSNEQLWWCAQYSHSVMAEEDRKGTGRWEWYETRRDDWTRREHHPAPQSRQTAHTHTQLSRVDNLSRINIILLYYA